MRRVPLLLLVAAVLAAPASAAAPPTLHVGSHGQRVRNLQWLLSGHDPSAYRKTIHPYRGSISGSYGALTRDAVQFAKWRLGYPEELVDGKAGPRLFRILLGREARPPSWISRAHARVRREQAIRARVLRLGSRGQRVRNLQWLLAGNEQSVYRKFVHPYRGRPVDGVFGRSTRDAVRAAKWRLGYPISNVTGTASDTLVSILLGRTARPIGWIGRASKRVAAAIAYRNGKINRIIRVEGREVGVHEIPCCNLGYRVGQYQAVTHTPGLAWCASFQQWGLLHSYGHTIANDSAGVFYIVRWAHDHALLRALPRPGTLVGFLHNLGHIGLVTSVTDHSFSTIEGNSGDAVRRHTYPLGEQSTVFIYLR